MTYQVVLLLILFTSVSCHEMSVSLPQRYTAMEGDVEVKFQLGRPNAFR